MQKRSRITKVAWFSAMFLAVVCLPISLLAQQTLLNRLSAEFKHFDGTLSQTIAGPPGILIYSKSVFVPATPVDNNTIYVTVSGTGVTQGPNAPAWFRCEVDGAPCNAGAGIVSGAPGGWVSLLRDTSILPDNAMNYTWCMKTQPGTHTVQVRMATGQPGAVVAIEAAHFYIDSNKISFQGTTGCSQAAQ